MKILLYGLNYAPELTGIGKYSGELCQWFVSQGHEVSVVCAPPYYPNWKIASGYRVWWYQYQNIDGVRVFRAPLYVPMQPKTLTRLLHLFSFSISSIPLLLLNILRKPDLVLTVEPTLFCTPGALFIAKVCGAKSILHIQDFELDAMLGLEMAKQGWLSKIGYKIESWAMSHFDLISSISFSMIETVKRKISTDADVVYFPNWADTKFVNQYADSRVFRKKWEISTNTKVMLYSGNLGKKQGLEIVLDAAKQLENERQLLFLIVGTGAAEQELKTKAESLRLKNLRFYPLQEYELLPSLMALGDIHLVVQKSGVADAVLPSKVSTILASGGHALISAEKNTEMGVICDKFPGIARRVKPEDSTAFLAALKNMLADIDVDNRNFNTIAREYAEKFLDKEHVLEEFMDKLKKLTGKD